MFFVERDQMACLVALEANRDHLGQLLVYMAMVQANQMAEEKSDSTDRGVLSDGRWFYFSRLNSEGRWRVVPYQVSLDGWTDIADMLVSLISQGRRTVASP